MNTRQVSAALTLFCLLLATPAWAFDILQALPKEPITPADNPVTSEKAELGKQLFFDPRLSADNTLSCNSCHNLAAGGDDDGAATRLSGKKLHRSAPTVFNAAYMSRLNWDTRAASLEEQVKDHLLDPQVMAMGVAENVVQKIASVPGYRQQFKKVFGESAVNWDNISKAIATFERTLTTPNSPFDQFIQGKDNAISAAAKRGLNLFTEIGCLSCHFGVNFAGPAPGPALNMGDGFYELFPNFVGTRYDEKYDLIADLGRYALTLDNGHKRMWRVPQLRNIALTAPYFHNGSVNSLVEAVKIMGITQLKADLSDQEIAEIVAFLESLTGQFPTITLPRLPETLGVTLVK